MPKHKRFSAHAWLIQWLCDQPLFLRWGKRRLCASWLRSTLISRACIDEGWDQRRKGQLRDQINAKSFRAASDTAMSRLRVDFDTAIREVQPRSVSRFDHAPVGMRVNSTYIDYG